MENSPQCGQAQTVPKCGTVQPESDKVTNPEICSLECGPAQPSKNGKNTGLLKGALEQPRQRKIPECDEAQPGSGAQEGQERKFNIKESLSRKRRREIECRTNEAEVGNSLTECGDKRLGEYDESYSECGQNQTEPKLKLPKLQGEVPRLAQPQADKCTQAAQDNKLGLSCEIVKDVEMDRNRKEKARKSTKNEEKWDNNVKAKLIFKRKPEANKFKSKILTKNSDTNSPKVKNFRGTNKMGGNVTKITKFFEKLQTKNEEKNRVQLRSNLSKPKLIGGGEIISGQEKGGVCEGLTFDSGGGEVRCMLGKVVGGGENDVPILVGGRGEDKTALDKGVGECEPRLILCRNGP